MKPDDAKTLFLIQQAEKHLFRLEKLFFKIKKTCPCYSAAPMRLREEIRRCQDRLAELKKEIKNNETK